MTDLADNLLELVRPQLEEMVAAEVERRRLVEVLPWMDSEEAGEYLRLSADAVRHRAQRGTIPAHRDEAGGRWLFHREEIDSSLGLSKRSC